MNTSISFWPLITIAALGVLIAAGCGRGAASKNTQTASSQIDRYPYSVFARIMDPVMPIKRGDKYEDPLSDTLEARKLGEVTGGGSQLDKDNKIQWVGIDIQLADLDVAVEVVRKRLRELGAPPGSVLEFKRGDQEVSLPIN